MTPIDLINEALHLFTEPTEANMARVQVLLIEARGKCLDTQSAAWIAGYDACADEQRRFQMTGERIVPANPYDPTSVAFEIPPPPEAP